MSEGPNAEVNRATAELGSAELAVKIDGEWCPEVRWYTRNLPVFFAEDGSEVDIRDDGSIQYETPRGAVQEIEPSEQTDLVDYYEPYSVYPADEIQVHRLDRYEQSEPADFGGGESTGVQDL